MFRYTLKEIFTYTGVSKWRIFNQLSKLAIWQALGKRDVIAPVNDYEMKLDLGTPGLSKVLYVYGTRELPDTHVVKEEVQPGMVVADIGANIGYYALMEAREVGPDGHVYAFEPDPRNLPLLKENVVLNALEEQVTIIPVAVADETGEKLFNLDERTNVSSFIARPDTVDTVEVPCIALHEFDHIDKVDMLRMDAEGYECKIIDGVLPHLEQNDRPFKVMLEVHADAYDEGEFNFIERLKKLFGLGFSTTRLIVPVQTRDEMRRRDYAPVGKWVETKHARHLYHHVAHADTIDLITTNQVRSLLLERA